MNSRKRGINVRLSEEQQRYLDEIIRKDQSGELNRSILIRRAISEYLMRHSETPILKAAEEPPPYEDSK